MSDTTGDTNSTGTSSQAQTQSSSAASDNKADQQPAHHVIFVVHGMGRQLEVPFGNYEKNVGHFVECTRTVLQSQFHELETNVHIIPIEWHAKLHSMVDERMALASLRTVPKVRLVMNDYMADILYYFNPHFGTQIVRMIVEELNEAYDLFLEKHPDFNGKISVYALSLGGVAMFDILTCQDDDDAEEEQSEASTTATGNPARVEVETNEVKEEGDSMQEPPAKKARVRKQDQPKFRAVIPKLKFRPEYLFTVGSPVGAVMVMRNLDWETFHPPDDIIHHNLFHPFDPLGYRLEPLIDPVFAGVPAAIVSSYQSQLFPSLLSLPSLPSLQLPESISAFWENRVPTLPRPSIPTLSSISLMTQSLKAGRWLPGSGSSAASVHADEEGNRSSSTSDSEEEDGEDSGANSSAVAGEDVDMNVSSPASSVSDAREAQDLNLTAIEKSENRSSNWEPESMMMDGGDASVSEFMGAATAATYLDLQSEDASTSGTGTSGGRQADVAAIKAQNDTTTESPQNVGRQPPTKRPSLGPRRISSRVEDAAAAAAAVEAKKAMGGVAEGSLLGSVEEGGASVTTTAQEKALGLGAKSDVIQESILRSMPESSSSTSTSGTDNAKMDTEEASDNTTTNASTTTAKKTVHVEGKATKLPYRIDHVLQETTVDQYTNEYLLGMRSHFKYWANKDVAYHILRTLLEPVDPESDAKVLDLKLSMPVPVSTTNGAKEAAEAKAKAASMAAAAGSSTTTRARSGTSGSIASDAEASNNKKQNRMSFGFAFFGGQSSTNSSSDDLTIQQQLSDEQERLRKRRQRREEEEVEQREQQERGGRAGDDFEEVQDGELLGYESSDVEMVTASRASVGWTRGTGSGSKSFATTRVSRTSAKTLFQSSPWPKKQGGGEGSGVEVSYTRTISTTSASNSSGNKRRISVERRSSSSVSVAVASTSTSAPNCSSEEEESTTVSGVDVPELTRPAKLHHRAARVEE
ncbi:hypothetical protein EC991_004131 [Linnemannia zychae]|nr:hypothetical protein EC991_004131 [Linnemannia zychae]